MKTLTATPAFGVDYKSRAAVLAAWNATKYFKLSFMGSSFYANNQQIPELKKDGYTHLQFRYAKLAKTFIHELK